MSTFLVSVIMPVYNAEKFVRVAVLSALSQEHVGEIILIEDGSPDDALRVCQQLEKEYDKVKLIRHVNGVNRGAGASRNLGIKAAVFPYIAFLDADDTYCEDRFRITKQIFEHRSDVDGVYEAIGVTFYDQAGKEAFCKMRNLKLDKADNYVTHLRIDDPRRVYEALIRGRTGYFNTSGVTIRKDVFSGSFFFNESLRLHQDIDLWIRLSYHFNFVPGSSQPVSRRGVHAENRISKQNLQSKYLYYRSLMVFFKHKNIPYGLKLYLFKSLVINNPRRRYNTSSNRLLRFAEYLVIAAQEVKNIPLL